jgi:gamma-glutamyl-gamma-aminobutyrate hydrolase PuuD
MSKQFIKLVQDEELYEAIRTYVLDIERPKYTEGMSMADYGAMCVAFEKHQRKMQERLDGLLLVGQQNMV